MPVRDVASPLCLSTETVITTRTRGYPGSTYLGSSIRQQKRLDRELGGGGETEFVHVMPNVSGSCPSTCSRAQKSESQSRALGRPSWKPHGARAWLVGWAGTCLPEEHLAADSSLLCSKGKRKRPAARPQPPGRCLPNSCPGDRARREPGAARGRELDGRLGGGSGRARCSGAAQRGRSQLRAGCEVNQVHGEGKRPRPAARLVLCCLTPVTLSDSLTRLFCVLPVIKLPLLVLQNLAIGAGAVGSLQLTYISKVMSGWGGGKMKAPCCPLIRAAFPGEGWLIPAARSRPARVVLPGWEPERVCGTGGASLRHGRSRRWDRCSPSPRTSTG